MDYTDVHTAISCGISGREEGGVADFTGKTKKLAPMTGLVRLRRQVMGRRMARLWCAHYVCRQCGQSCRRTRGKVYTVQDERRYRKKGRGMKLKGYQIILYCPLI